MCTNVVFLQEEKYCSKCTNVAVFLQEEKEIVGMCTSVVVFSSGGERDSRHLY